MGQAREHLDLASEALGSERRAEVRVKHLHGNVTAVLDVPGEMHCCHPATAQLVLESVSLGERGRQPSSEVAQRRFPWSRLTILTGTVPR